LNEESLITDVAGTAGLVPSEVASVSPASFRDPAGFVFLRAGMLYRQVNVRGRDDYDMLMRSGLYGALTKNGWLVSHQEVDDPFAEPENAYRVLVPDRVGFISYPYEWSFSQLQDAALLTLDIQLLALQHGMSLKDASAYNIQFEGGKPIFIDTLSFEPYQEGKPWVAYRQYCQHFLAPLALMAKVDVRLNQLLRTGIDGVPLELASRMLPRRTRWQLGLGLHIHLHAKAQRTHSSTDQPKLKREVKVSRVGLTGMLQGLRRATAKLCWRPAGTEWGAYYQATNYSDTAFDHKKLLVSEYLEQVSPERVWDLGANTGVFSRLASSHGIGTVAFDVDPAAVEINYLEAKARAEANLLPLLLDFTNPSPGLGWAGTERSSLFDRGPVDCAMALALIHHLAISNNVPLTKLAETFARLCKCLIIEFVPKSDSQVKRLLASREDIFGNYDQAGFEAAFATRFETVRREPVKGTERTLYLMRRSQ